MFSVAESNSLFLELGGLFEGAAEGIVGGEAAGAIDYPVAGSGGVGVSMKGVTDSTSIFGAESFGK